MGMPASRFAAGRRGIPAFIKSAALTPGKKMGADESAQNYQRRRMKTWSLMTLHALINLYSNSDARRQTTLNQLVKNYRQIRNLRHAHHLGRFDAAFAPIQRERLRRTRM
jgi:hypothetical protein